MKSVIVEMIVPDSEAKDTARRVRSALEREFWGNEIPDSDKPVHLASYWYPFMNDVVKANLGEGEEMTEAMDLVRDWTLAIDGGAFVGIVSNRLADKFQAVHAIEAARANFDCLVRNVKSNVICHHACLCNTMSEAGYTAVPDKDVRSPVCHMESGGMIPPLTIDSFKFESCGFIKLDLQGFDYFALLGAEQTLRRFKPVVHFEHDPGCYERYGIEAGAPGDFLTALGYRKRHFAYDGQTWA